MIMKIIIIVTIIVIIIIIIIIITKTKIGCTLRKLKVTIFNVHFILYSVKKMLLNSVFISVEENVGTCVESVTEINKWFRLKDMLDSVFSEIFTPYELVLAALIRK